MQKDSLNIQRSSRFNQHITEWNRLLHQERNTWKLSKKLFRRAHSEFRKVTNLTFQKLVKENQNTYLLYQAVNGVTESFEAANTISTTIPQMMQELQQLGDQMQQIMRMNLLRHHTFLLNHHSLHSRFLLCIPAIYLRVCKIVYIS